MSVDSIVLLQKKVDRRFKPDYKEYVSPGEDCWIDEMRTKQCYQKYSHVREFISDAKKIEQSTIAYHRGGKHKQPGQF